MANFTDFNLTTAPLSSDFLVGYNTAGTSEIRTTISSLLSSDGSNLSVVSDNSKTKRSLAIRFADSINIKDFGAVGDGVTDDWLAIARALYAACYDASFDYIANSLPLPSKITLSDISSAYTSLGIPNVPILRAPGQQKRPVIIPPGTYSISRPIPVSHGTQLFGLHPDKCIIKLPANSTFNGIENYTFGLVRDYWNLNGGNNQTPLENLALNSYNANLHIANLCIRHEFEFTVTRSGTTATATKANHGWQVGDKIYVSGESPFGYGTYTITATSTNTFDFTVANSGSTSALVDIVNITKINDYPKAYYPANMYSWAKVSIQANSGTNQVTVNKWIAIYIGAKIKFNGGNEIYEVASYTTTSDTTTLTLTSNLTRTVSVNEILLIGFPAINGILINGGENSSIDYVYTEYMRGAGIYIFYGSPGITINDCMSNLNVVGFWQDGASPINLIKPSGDANYVFFRSGFLGSGLQSNIIGLKMEDFGGYPSDCVFEIATDSSGGQSCLNVIGGTINPANNTYYNSDLPNRSLVKVWTKGTQAIVNINGLFANAYGNYTFKNYNRTTGEASGYNTRGRFAPTDGDGHSVIGGTSHFGQWFMESFPDQSFNQRFKVGLDGSNKAIGGGILGEAMFEPVFNVPFTRNNTTVTFTSNNHMLEPGDFVELRNANNVNPWLSFGSSSSGDPSYGQGTCMVQTADSNTFTITVNNSGPASGIAHIGKFKVFYFHILKDGTHRIQMPNTSTVSDAMVFQLLGHKKQEFAGLIVPSTNTNTAHWWVKEQLRLGGTAQNPSIQITTGSGAPTASAPDGSIYMRTDGTLSSTLYVRTGGTWRAATLS